MYVCVIIQREGNKSKNSPKSNLFQTLKFKVKSQGMAFSVTFLYCEILHSIYEF